MKKFLFTLVATMSAAFLLACGSGEKSSNATSTIASSTTTPVVTEAPVETPAVTEPVEEAVYPLTVTDQAGREVTINSKPEKIVSGYYISTSTLIALGLKDSLVGIEAKANKRPIYKLSAKELIDLPNVGSAKDFDLEGCAALKPDLVILPKKLKDAAKTLSDLGIAVVLVNPESKDDLVGMIELLSKATDCSRGEELIQYINDANDKLKTTLASESIPNVYISGNESLLSTAGGKMYQSYLISSACGKNVAEDLDDTYWAEVGYEQIIAWNPEFIILPSDASFTVEDVLNDENLQSVTAIKDKNVFQMPSNIEAWDSPVPGSFLGSYWLASVLHSNKLSDDDYAACVDDFYNNYYGFSTKEN